MPVMTEVKAVLKTTPKHHPSHGPEHCCAPYPVYPISNEPKCFPSFRT